jgi:HAD superfamily hydrolase (TIGR01509 family)
MPVPPVRALIFDFDGLILDTEMPEYEAWHTIYAEYGCELPLALWADSIGRGHEQIKFDPYEYLSTYLGEPIDTDAIRARKRLLFQERVNRLPPRPGVLDYLAEAKVRGLGLAVASSSPHVWVDGYLAQLGILDRFATTLCSEDVVQTKPAPDLFLAAVEALGFAPNEAIAFEDSPNGVLAARRAGLYTVVVPNELTTLLHFPDSHRRIASMAEVPLGEILAGRDAFWKGIDR